MTCKEMEPRLAGLIDGALVEGERERVEAHLQSCEECRRALAELQASDALVKRLEEVEPPPWLKTRVMARVREEAQGKKNVFRRLFFPLHIKVPIQALATVLIAVVAWNVYRTGEPDFRPAAPPPVEVQEAPKAQAPQAPGPDADAAKRQGIPAAREKRTLAPPPAAVEDRGGRTAEPDREMAKADAARPSEPSGAQRPAAAPPKDEEALKRAGAKGQQEADRSARVLAPEQKQKVMKAPLGHASREVAKREAAPAASPMLSANLSPRPDLDLSLRTGDPGRAADELEELLRAIGAQSIDKTTREGQVTLTARIRPEHLDALREKLMSLGLIRESVSSAPRPGVPLAIRLEIRHE